MKKILPGLACLLALAACATPQYMSPDVTESEIRTAAMPRSVTIERVHRDEKQAFEVVAAAEARLRPAIHGLCLEVSGENCAFHVHIEDDETPNAFASEGGRITITTGMLQYLESEDEVAFVLAHEIAHHMADHLTAQRRNASVGAAVGALLLGGLVAATSRDSDDRQAAVSQAAQMGLVLGAHGGRLSYSKAQEREADYLGIYAIELAGYDTRAAARVMDKFALIDPRSGERTSFFGTHPSSPEREARALKVRREIAAKRAAGQPVMPNRAPQAN